MATAGAVIVLAAGDSKMTQPVRIVRWRFWLGIVALIVATLWLLHDILLPFVVGAIIAYFFDPVVARLQAWGLSRGLATAATTVFAVVLIVGVIVAVLPPLVGQAQHLITKAPEYITRATERLQPLVEPLRDKFGGLFGVGVGTTAEDLQSEASKWSGEALTFLGGLLAGLARRGVAIINLLGLLFITPVVTFYLLRDWERLLANLDSWLPRENAGTIRKLARESDAAIAGYVRGQALVCLCLALLYSVGLSLAGLEFGFVIGLIAGMISFIPFVGTMVGAVMALGMALAQFPPDWIGVVKVGAVFLAGHLLESNFLSPKLVGDRVGLHPVWIMFALLSGGALFGFVGVLIAVPVAAMIGVVVRHLLDSYLASGLYRGSDGV